MTQYNSNIRQIIIALAVLLLKAACSMPETATPPAPVYAEAVYWFSDPAAQSAKQADICYASPFYRQLTMNACNFGPRQVNQLMKIPVSDITRAFEHYMEHHNNGRPFILLGHSQGSAVLLELLKHGMKPKKN